MLKRWMKTFKSPANAPVPAPNVAVNVPLPRQLNTCRTASSAGSATSSQTGSARLCAVIFAGLCLLASPASAIPGVYGVTNANDTGAGSLRQAILNANAGGIPASIGFNLPGSAPFTINLLSPLPVISNAAAIDGTTQPGYSGTPVVVLDGSGAGTNANGLYLAGGNSTVRGLGIERFSAA